MKTMLVALLLSVPFIACAAPPEPAAAPSSSSTAAPTLPPGMKQYWFVMLKTGPKRDHPPEEAKALQAGHMANMQAYADKGALQIAGPFMDDGEWRGIFILDVPDRAGAEAMCNADPAVEAGRLVCDIHPWLSQKGATLK
ncbi:MAG: YciI family protein [Lysobacteraceae bacterium]